MINESSEKWVYRIVVGLAATIFSITAWNSHGFYHADEHYQIIEFAGLKMGTHGPSDLAWEFQSRIRSSVMPALCFVVFKGLHFANIEDPYLRAFVLRLIGALFSLLVIAYFIKQTDKQIENQNIRIAYRVLSWFLWYIPFLSVRFSSETWSGLCFLLSIALFLSTKKEIYKPYIQGVLFGIAFLLRFQTAFLIIGFVCWLIFVNRYNFSYLLKLSSTFLLIFVFGILLDRWFYSDWTITAWNYLNFNIFEDVASDFGTSAWYYYVLKLIQIPTYFIGIPLIIAFIILIVKSPKNMYIWTIAPFFIVHSIIPHKEDRFLFPLVYFFPLLMVTAYQIIIPFLKGKMLKTTFNYLLIGILLIVNAVGLFAMAQKSAGIGRMEITKYIHDNYRNEPVVLVYTSWANPYNPWQSLPMIFYLEKNISDKHIMQLDELNDSLLLKNQQVILSLRKADLDKSGSLQIIDSLGFKIVKQSIPMWMERVNKYYQGFNNYDIVQLYCRKSKKTINYVSN